VENVQLVGAQVKVLEIGRPKLTDEIIKDFKCEKCTK
jgi:hypothetical protein